MSKSRRKKEIAKTRSGGRRTLSKRNPLQQTPSPPEAALLTLAIGKHNAT